MIKNEQTILEARVRFPKCNHNYSLKTHYLKHKDPWQLNEQTSVTVPIIFYE
jgi:hypothetical protein